MLKVSRISCTLFVSCLLAFLAAPQPSNALSYTGNPLPRHVQLTQQLNNSKKRMVKVRQNPIIDLGKNGGGNTANAAANGAGTGQNAAAADNQDTGTTSVATNTAATQQSQTTSAAAATTPSALQTTSDVTQTVSTASGVSVTSFTSSLSSVSQPTATSTSNSLSLNIVTQPTPSLLPGTVTNEGGSTVAFQSTINASAQPTGAASQASNSSANTTSRNSIIAIVVIASCVGGAAAIWTLIRKWKLGPSAKFDERMQPIEWSPEMGAAGRSGLPGSIREREAGSTGADLNRAGSTTSHGSFHSSDADHNNIGRNITGNANMFADQNPVQGLDHDFTAGTATYASNAYDYNAGGGYHDLQRAKSGARPGADLASVGQAAYPSQYDQNYSNNAYNRQDGYAQDAYGGYDTYGQQQYAAGGAEQYPRGQHANGYQGARY